MAWSRALLAVLMGPGLTAPACARAPAPPSEEPVASVTEEAPRAPAPVAPQEDPGVCVAGLEGKKAARAWAESFRLPGVETTAPPVVRLVDGGGEAPVQLGDAPAWTWLQVVDHAEAKIAVLRQFVAVEVAPGRVSACAVAEHRGRSPAEGYPIFELQRGGVEAAASGVLHVSTELQGGPIHGRDRDTLCRVVDGELGCLSVARAGGTAIASTADGIRYRFGGDTIRRAFLPFTGGAATMIDEHESFPILGRPDGAGPPAAVFRVGVPVEELSDKDASAWQGGFQRHGPCIANAPNWDTAELWAESFRAETRPGEEAPEVSLERAAVAGSIGEHAVRTYAQHEHFHGWAVARVFVMVKTGATISACVVADDHLEYGYFEGPTPKRGTFRERGPSRFEFTSTHAWHTATAEEESAEWTVACAVEGGLLGCASLRARWVEQEPNNGGGDAEYVPVTHAAAITRAAEGYTWSFGGAELHAPLVPGESIIVDREIVRLASSATLGGQP